MVNRNTKIRGTQIFDGTISEVKLDVSNAPVDGYFLKYNSAEEKFEWVAGSDAVTEIPVGLINGTNSSYALTNAPESGSLHVYLNGMFQEEGAGKDYVLSGTDIVFVIAPETSDNIIATYLKEVTVSSENLLYGTAGYIIDGGEVVITTGIQGQVEVPFDCTLEGITLIADQTGSIVVDIKKSTYANFPTTVSIVNAGTKPNLNSERKSKDVDLTNYTTQIDSGDILEFVVDSASVVEKCLVSLKLKKR